MCSGSVATLHPSAQAERRKLEPRSHPVEFQMPVSVLFMSMSLDGYIAGPGDSVENPGGHDFDRLHEWFGDFSRPSGPVGEMWDEWNPPGAIVAGRRTVEQVDHWGGNNQGVPIFVPSHRPPNPSVANYPLVKYVNDGIETTMRLAKAAAGNRIVLMHGAYTAQRALEAGVLDELQIHQIPVLFGGGRRLFDVLPSRVELDVVRVIDTPKATHVRYRVRR
jgi:dihydrofolate reductase